MGAGVFVAAYRDPEDAEEDEGEDEDTEDSGSLVDVTAKRMSDIESSGFDASAGGRAN